MKKIAVFLLGVIAGLLLVELPAVASGDEKGMSLSENVKVVLYYDKLNFTDVNGKEVQPFTINGTTYAPVRGLANALGKDILWDEAANTVTIVAKRDNTNQSHSGPGDPTYESCDYIRDLVAERLASNELVDEVIVAGFSFWGFDRNNRYCFAVDYSMKIADKELTVYETDGSYRNATAFDCFYNEPIVAIRGTADEATGWIYGRRKFIHAYMRDGVLYDWSISDNMNE